MRNVGLIGKARSGKDSVASRLVANRGYQRVAFADPLKDMALRIDPIVSAHAERYHEYGTAGGVYPVWEAETVSLSDVISRVGWERAKDEYPEVRRILQSCGQTVRELDADFWLRIALAKVAEANQQGRPVVVSDVRYPNEAESLRRAGFTLIRITRPAIAGSILRADPASAHESETALDGYHADHTIVNNGSLETLNHIADSLRLH